MCKNLIEKGNLDKPLIIFNRTQKRATDLNTKLPSGKSTVALSLDEAVARADIIFTCLGDDAATEETIEAAAKGNIKESSSSTVQQSILTLRLCWLRASMHKVQKWWHVQVGDHTFTQSYSSGLMRSRAVFGAPAMADNGQLVCVLAGPSSAVEK